MAPVLEAIAPTLKGKMAIGKIDCTKHKVVCKEQKVKGFPTLKYSIDGQIFDYSGGRDEKSLVAFAEKMSSPPITHIRRLEEAMKFAKNTADEGIVFLGSSPKDSELYKLFSQVARKNQASVYFLWLDQLEGPTDDGRDNAYIERIESGVREPRRWDATELSEETLTSWIKDQNVPTLSMLTPSNFPRISRNGRPLVMGIVDMEDEQLVEGTKNHMMDYILRSPQDIVQKHYYGIFDGKKWQKFLLQFGVKQEDNPQYLILAPLDQPGKTYWRNETYTKLTEFLVAVDDGTIPPRNPERTNFIDNPFEWMTKKFVHFMPFSVVPIVALLGVIIYVATPSSEHFVKKRSESDEGSTKNEDSKKDK
ncbi:MAG: hypothetical protein ACI8RD_004964 [Bacillariaceae sp.]|jgi:hypothetical protein